jgi:hypothetical protein
MQGGHETRQHLVQRTGGFARESDAVLSCAMRSGAGTACEPTSRKPACRRRPRSPSFTLCVACATDSSLRSIGQKFSGGVAVQTGSAAMVVVPNQGLVLLIFVAPVRRDQGD